MMIHKFMTVKYEPRATNQLNRLTLTRLNIILHKFNILCGNHFGADTPTQRVVYFRTRTKHEK